MRARWIIKLQVCIDLEKVRNNILAIRAKLEAGKGEKRRENGTEFLLMVKADAYGLGLERVAKATADLVDAYGVVTLEEAVNLRKTCGKTPILANYIAPNEIKTAVENDVNIGLSDFKQFEELLQFANGFAQGADGGDKISAQAISCSIAVDSGMHRLGFDVGDVDGVCRVLKTAGVSVNAIYSHFGDHYENQKERFDKACNVARRYFPNIKRHIASSHQLDDESVRYDCVRVGLSAYTGALTVRSRVIAARTVESGEYVGYGDYKTANRTNIAVVFGGYAEGIDRERFSCLYARGKAYKVVCVCMDTFLVDTKGDMLETGEEVVLLDGNTLDEQAKTMQTIPYTLLTRWRGRIDKIYV